MREIFTCKSLAFTLLILLPFIGIAQSGIPRIVINPKGHSAKINRILYTPDGEKIISVSEDKTIRLWSAQTGELLDKFESQIGDGFNGMFYSAAISPDGKLLAVAGYPVETEESNYIILIDLNRGIQIATAIGHTNVINGLDFSGDGKFLLSGGDDGQIKIWKIDRSKLLKEVGTIDVGLAVSSISVNPNEKRVAVAAMSNEVKMYDFSSVENGEELFPMTTLKKHNQEINKVVFSPDGQWLATSTYGDEVALWKSNGDLQFFKDSYETPINAMSFSYDGRVLVALDITGRGYSYSIPSGTVYTDEFMEHDNVVFSAAFSPQSTDGNYVIASAGGTRNEIIIWNAISAKKIREIKGKGSFIGDLVFGNGLELYISTQFRSESPEYNISFDFNTMSINPVPEDPPSREYLEMSKLVSETSDPYILE